VVVGQDDVVMLKLIKPPSMAEYQALKQRLQQQAREAGREPSDVAEAVRRTRGHE
jgi:hypothetical protein